MPGNDPRGVPNCSKASKHVISNPEHHHRSPGKISLNRNFDAWKAVLALYSLQKDGKNTFCEGDNSNFLDPTVAS